MRIIIATENYYPHLNGTSYFIQRLAYLLKKGGHAVLVICPSKTGQQGYYSHKHVGIFGIYSIPVMMNGNFRFSPGFLISKIKLRNAIKKFHPDAVHLQDHLFIARAVQKIANEMNLKTVGTNHFTPENFLHYLNFLVVGKSQIKKYAQRNLVNFLSKLDIVTTPTKMAADLLKGMGFSKPVIPISCGIDLKQFNPERKGQYLKDRYGIANKKIILYVGRLSPEKNLDAVMMAFQLAYKEIHNLHLVLAGAGRKLMHLKRLAKRLGIGASVTFTGFVPDKDLMNMYGIADCFIIAGNVELQSIATMEAMASGLPVIAADAMALPELVKHGKNGFLFKLGQTQEIAGYMVQLLSNKGLCRRMGRESLKIIKGHDITKTIEAFESLYKKVY
jgi:glycosyltransferase involved in cell wall biosynthesis